MKHLKYLLTSLFSMTVLVFTSCQNSDNDNLDFFSENGYTEDKNSEDILKNGQIGMIEIPSVPYYVKTDITDNVYHDIYLTTKHNGGDSLYMINYENMSKIFSANTKSNISFIAEPEVIDIDEDGQKDFVYVGYDSIGPMISIIFPTPSVINIHKKGYTKIPDMDEHIVLQEFSLFSSRLPEHHGGFDDMEIGDIDNDGRPDVAVSSDSGVSVYDLYSGKLRFHHKEYCPSSLVIDDIDNDGKKELIFHTAITEHPELEVDGSFHFMDENGRELGLLDPIKLHKHTWDIYVDDFDQDGQKEIVAADITGYGKIYLVDVKNRTCKELPILYDVHNPYWMMKSNNGSFHFGYTETSIHDLSSRYDNLDTKFFGISDDSLHSTYYTIYSSDYLIGDTYYNKEGEPRIIYAINEKKLSVNNEKTIDLTKIAPADGEINFVKTIKIYDEIHFLVGMKYVDQDSSIKSILYKLVPPPGWCDF